MYKLWNETDNWKMPARWFCGQNKKKNPAHEFQIRCSLSWLISRVIPEDKLRPISINCHLLAYETYFGNKVYEILMRDPLTRLGTMAAKTAIQLALTHGVREISMMATRCCSPVYLTRVFLYCTTYKWTSMARYRQVLGVNDYFVTY